MRVQWNSNWLFFHLCSTFLHSCLRHWMSSIAWYSQRTGKQWHSKLLRSSANSITLKRKTNCRQNLRSFIPHTHAPHQSMLSGPKKVMHIWFSLTCLSCLRHMARLQCPQELWNFLFVKSILSQPLQRREVFKAIEKNAPINHSGNILWDMANRKLLLGMQARVLQQLKPILSHSANVLDFLFLLYILLCLFILMIFFTYFTSLLLCSFYHCCVYDLLHAFKVKHDFMSLTFCHWLWYMDPNDLHSAFVIDTVPNLSDVRAWLQRSNRWLRGGTRLGKTWDRGQRPAAREKHGGRRNGDKRRRGQETVQPHLWYLAF